MYFLPYDLAPYQKIDELNIFFLLPATSAIKNLKGANFLPLLSIDFLMRWLRNSSYIRTQVLF